MGDDFDLFPKRENLDPFSFKTKEKKTEQPEQPEDLFGVEEQPSPPPSGAPPSDVPAGAPPTGQPGPADIPVSDPFPPLEPPAEPVVHPEPAPAPEPEGPISESKTFDEPDDEIMPLKEESGAKKKKTHSPFIIVGGALIIIIGLLYLALTFLKRDKPPVPAAPVPQATVSVEPRTPAPVPVPEKEKPEQEVPVEPPAVSTSAAEAAETGPGEQQAQALVPEVKKPAAPEPDEEKPEPQAAVTAVETSPAGARYSVQTGAFILEASVRELEDKMASLGYKTFRKEGSTTVMMNMLTVGPFSTVEKARRAVSDLTDAGIDSNLVRRTGGGAVVNAGSYLLDENARMIERKIRNMGYPVTSVKKEARLPMTFVRTGRFEDISKAASLRDELKEKGLDAIVVKLQ